ncbi:MAG: chloramphenicol phosphotransferase CPT family protein [Rhizobiaceae bacterium]
MLNGVGSAGKSSIARELQAIATVPLLHVSMDAFLDTLPEPLRDDPGGFAYETTVDAGKPSVAVAVGPLGERLLAGMHRAVAALAMAGNGLIYDTVLTRPADKADLRDALSSLAVSWVGVIAPLDVLEEREARRGDRLAGLARWQFERVHDGMSYDLKVDTGKSSALECAENIRLRLRL